MAVSIYQDANRIYDDIVARCEISDSQLAGNLAATAWNIMCAIPNPDEVQYDTVMNGIRNSYWTGQKSIEACLCH